MKRGRNDTYVRFCLGVLKLLLLSWETLHLRSCELHLKFSPAVFVRQKEVNLPAVARGDFAISDF